MKSSTVIFLAFLILLAFANHGHTAVGDIIGNYSGLCNVALDTSGNVYLSDTSNNRILLQSKLTPQTPRLIAGNGVQGYSGDGGVATAANLSHPGSLAVDSKANLYVIDTDNHCVRKVSGATGIITTVAGNGMAGDYGDGRTTTAVNLSSPGGLAVDSAGNLYIADTGNNRILKLSSGNAAITIVAGTGVKGFSGDGGAATSANLSSPSGVAADSAGNLYIADTGNDRIRVVLTASGNIINSVTGGSACGGLYGYEDSYPNSWGGWSLTGTGTSVCSPSGVAVDGRGNLYIADTLHSAVRILLANTTLDSRRMFTIAGKNSHAVQSFYYHGTANNATLYPLGVAVDGEGNVYIATYSGVQEVVISPPGAPTGVSLIASSTSGDVSFTPPVDSGSSAITSYTLTLTSGNISTPYYYSIGGYFVLQGLTQGATYTFTIKATNAAGTGPDSLASPSITTLTAPTNVSALAGNARATVSFTAPTSAGGSAITSYTVTSSPGNISITGSTSPIVVTGLTNGTAYTFKVQATNAVGTGGASAASISATPFATPGVPLNVVALAGNAQATVSFTAPVPTGASAITSYTVISSPGSITATGSTSPIVVTGLTNGTAYTFTVKATNAAGAGDASAHSASVTLLPLPTISGTPPSVAIVGIPYYFAPNATNAKTFSITGNLPPGISLSTTNGILSGTPTTLGIYSNIIISANSDIGSASLPAFTITLADLTVPVVSAFSLPVTATSLTVPILSLLATDNVAVTGYLVTETLAAPLASATGWSLAVPASYTFATGGTKTLYAWAKDFAGNVSAAATATVLVDTTKPTVSAFTLPTSYNSLAVPVYSFTATDDLGVRAYLITTSATAPLATDINWSATAPASFTFAPATTNGVHTLYAWAKDGAGNISSNLSAKVTVDNIGPTLSLSTLANGAITNNVTLNVTGTVSDSSGVLGLTINNVNVTVTNGSFGYSLILQTGSNTITTIGTDTLGNRTTDTRSIILGQSAILAVTVTGSGGGTVTSSPSGIACVSGSTKNCSTTVAGGSTISLYATPDNNSTFGGWSGDCQGTSVCGVSMTASHSVISAFIGAPNTKTGNIPYGTLLAACTAASNGATVLAREIEFDEDLIFGNGGNVILRGGYDGLFSTYSGNFTTIKGSLKIRNGRLTVDGLLIY